jgi:hypothetical protein
MDQGLLEVDEVVRLKKCSMWNISLNLISISLASRVLVPRGTIIRTK